MAIIPTSQLDHTAEDIRLLVTYDERFNLSNIRECNRRTGFELRRAKISNSFHRREDTEKKLIEALKLVQGVTIITDLPFTHLPITVTIASGHIVGTIHGMILGVSMAPKTWHIYEGKELSQDKLHSLQTDKSFFGDKNALENWDIELFKRAQIFMHETGTTRHYFVGATCGVKAIETCRTEYQPDKAMKYIAQLDQIVFDNELPDRTHKESLCGECPFSDICKGNSFAQRDCRNCIHSSPIADGEWICDRWKINMKDFIACPTHKYIPDYVPGKIIEAGADFIKYQLRNGVIFLDSENGEDFLP